MLETYVCRLVSFWWTWIFPAIQGGCIAGMSNLMCQWLSGSMQKRQGATGFGINFRQVSSFAAFTFTYCGFFQRILYQQFDIWFTNSLQKMIADCVWHAPLLYLPAFQITTGLIQGKSLKQCVAELRASYVQKLCAYIGIWPLAMLAIFAFVPESSRLLALCCVGFVEKAVYSWIELKNSTATAYVMKPYDSALPINNVLQEMLPIKSNVSVASNIRTEHRKPSTRLPTRRAQSHIAMAALAGLAVRNVPRAQWQPNLPLQAMTRLQRPIR